MKDIRAIIQPFMLNKVLDALHACEHFPGLTISDCQGQGRGRGTGGHYQAEADTIFLAKKVRLDITCGDDVCDHVVDVIAKAARTGNKGDGLITVTDVAKVLRIRTGATQDDAV